MDHLEKKSSNIIPINQRSNAPIVPPFMQTAPKNLVFAGGGVLGLAYIGVRAALEHFQFPIEQIQRVGGTSAGAMNALVMALGLSTEETLNLLLATNFENFLDKSSVPRSLFLRLTHPSTPCFFKATGGAAVAAIGASELATNYGLYKGDFIVDWLEKLILEKTKIANCTFKQLFELSQTDPKFKQLAVKIVNLNHHRSETLSYETSPDFKIAVAVRASMSVPYVFHPVENSAGDQMVDGGLLDNYPLSLFDKGKFVESVEVEPEQEFINMETLGFNFVSAQEPKRIEINNLIQFAGAIAWTLATSQLDQIQENAQRTVSIYPGKINPLAFDLNHEKIKQLIKAGWDSVCAQYGQQLELPPLLNHLPEIAEPVPQKYSCAIS